MAYAFHNLAARSLRRGKVPLKTVLFCELMGDYELDFFHSASDNAAKKPSSYLAGGVRRNRNYDTKFSIREREAYEVHYEAIRSYRPSH